LVLQDPAKVAFITQTTLSVDDTRAVIEALRRRFPAIVGPDVKDICYATQNRQEAVKLLCGRVDVLLVVGARNSSIRTGCARSAPSSRCRLPDRRRGRDRPGVFAGAATVGLTAGASAPEELVRE